ncbi:hypothetical protein GQX73_g10536 [Xylaria multiplex]|uniref:Uncharacterized protein n=1 Tax=Xylaria multiplex TaxID=323545 RepID=A0A7C8MIA9_9PEZI|nr:hypothetical protein GQX73_g10536 [Xylaria multiplex]
MNTYNSDGSSDPNGDILHGLRDMVERTDPRGTYYIEPTWRINGIPLSRCVSPDLHQSTRVLKPLKFESLRRPRKPTLKQHLRELRSSELREIIMNVCLKSLNTHKDVVQILKRMQKKKPRPISHGERVENPTAGLYLYCRTHRELVDIIIELAGYDESGYFERDVRDLGRVIQEKGRNACYF